MTLANRMILAAAMLAFSAPALASDEVTATPQRDTGPMAARELDSDADSASRAVSDYLKTVHGEVTMMVGSDGTYGVSGTAELPLGENGSAIISMSKGKDYWFRSPYSLAPDFGVDGQPLPYGFGRHELR